MKAGPLCRSFVASWAGLTTDLVADARAPIRYARSRRLRAKPLTLRYRNIGYSMQTEQRARVLRQIPRSVWVLGCVSLFMDVSSEIIHSLLPMFLMASLGASATTIGLIEGIAEATAPIVKVFSGTLSDYLGNRKWLAVAGYGLGALSKPLFAVAPTIGIVVTARIMDRVGKGIRGAPRDALVADVTPPHLRGAAFGLRQSLDTVGAFLGPLLAVVIMLVWADNFRLAFWFAVIPGLLAGALLTVGIEEPAREPGAKRVNPIHWDSIRQLGASRFLRPDYRVAFVRTDTRHCGTWWSLGTLLTLAASTSSRKAESSAT